MSDLTGQSILNNTCLGDCRDERRTTASAKTITCVGAVSDFSHHLYVQGVVLIHPKAVSHFQNQLLFDALFSNGVERVQGSPCSYAGNFPFRRPTFACYFNLKVHTYPYQPSAPAMTIAFCGLLYTADPIMITVSPQLDTSSSMYA